MITTNPSFQTIITLILILFFVQNISSQNVTKTRSTFSAAGSSKAVISNNYSFYYQQCIGQSSSIGLKKSNNIHLRQGFLQPIYGTVRSHNPGFLQAVILQDKSNQQLTIKLQEVITQDINIDVYDLCGRVLYSERHKPCNEIYLQLGMNEPTFYIIRVYSGQKCFVGKIVN